MKSEVLHGDCLEVMKEMESNSVDAIVTDPPYGLSFMGKKWDYDVPSTEIWEEALRVLKPGGYLLAFAGTRTQHRMAVRIEDAGFEIRDMIAWVYGSGFPKSLDIGKAVDKLLGNERKIVGMESYTAPEIKGNSSNGRGISGINNANKDRLGVSITKGSSDFEGFGTALKPALEPITVARKPLSEKTVAENCLKWGVGGIDIDGSRVETSETLNGGRHCENSIGNDMNSYGTGINKPSKEPYVQPSGRFPANLIHDGSDEVVSLFPNTKSGVGKIGTGNGTDNQDIFGKGKGGTITSSFGDKGSAARFFYQAEFGNIDNFNYLGTTNKNNSPCQDQNKSQSNANTAQLNLSLQELVEDSVLKLVAIKDSQEDSPLKSITTPFMTEMQMLLRKGCDIDTKQILSLGQKCLQELKLTIMAMLNKDHVNYVEIQNLTSTMTIIQNLMSIDGFVEVVISNIMLSNMVLGVKGSRFKYCAKASSSERGSSNNHPTVKPIALMEYLVKLVCRKGSIVLDPFAGSGTTAIACKKTRRQFIVIERDLASIEIINTRLSGVKEFIHTPTLFDSL